MGAAKIIAILLIAAGVIGLAYGGFSYTEDKQVAKLGSVELTVKDEKTVGIPLWLSVVAIAAGAGLLAVGGRR